MAHAGSSSLGRVLQAGMSWDHLAGCRSAATSGSNAGAVQAQRRGAPQRG